MKINKIKMLISSILIIIPTIITALFSKKIDGMIISHLGINGKDDGYMSPLHFVLIVPITLIVIQWLCVWITIKTNSREDQNKKVTEIIYWICPAISIYSSIIMISISCGYELDIISLSCVLFGLLFSIIGNYMPKCKQNSTMGIKIKWTLTNEENWNLTHRFAGKVWFVGGVALMLCVFLPDQICIAAFLTIMFINILLPTIFSYMNYRTQIKEGRATKSDFEIPKRSKKAVIISNIVITLVFIAIAILMFTGDVNINCEESYIHIKSTYQADMTIAYDDISEISLTDKHTAVRIMGFGSPRLSLGVFKSEELGNITSYCYAQNKTAIVIKTKNDHYIVINQIDSDKTTALYNELTKTIGKSE